MILLVLGCIFIDDAEHGTFLEGLGNGPRQDSGDSGDTADSAETGFGEGDVLVAEAGAGWSPGVADDAFGGAVAVDSVEALGLATFASGSGEGRAAVWGFAAEKLVAGAVMVFNPTEGTVTDVGAESFGAAVAVVERSDGERRLLSGVPGQSAVGSYVPREVGTSHSDGALVGEVGDDGFGSAVATWDEDASLVGIGAPASECGAAYAGYWPVRDDETLDATVLFTGGQGRKLVPEQCEESEPQRFGASLAFGDFTSAGQPGILIGAPGDDDGRGAVYIVPDLFGAPDDNGVVYAADAVKIVGEDAGCAFGAAVAAADINGDGYDDAIVGAPNLENGEQGAGTVYIFTGSDGLVSSGAGEAGVKLRSYLLNAQFGASLAPIEGRGGYAGEDIAVGAPGWFDDGGAPGAVFVFAGEGLESDTAESQKQMLRGSDSRGRFGASLASNPKAGRALVVGEPGADVEEAVDAGVAWWIVLDP
ncbi:hypothetical protein LBMAG42_29790 [Deltaproteobacteria bacterium]|nr:hypothetical protein LBMAG42_29790 [Deltaproteobacteria bacterium]